MELYLLSPICFYGMHRSNFTFVKFVRSEVARISGCINPGRQGSRVITFGMVDPNVCVSSEWKFIHVTFLAPRILKSLLGFWNICGPLWCFSYGGESL